MRNRPAINLQALTLCLAYAIAPTAFAADETDYERRLRVTIGAGLDFSRGDYGSNDTTDIGSLSVFTKWEWEPITFRVSVPFTVIDGSETVFGGEAGGDVGGDDATATTRTDYGLGDVTTSLTYTYYPSADLNYLPIVDLTTKVKIPTAMNNLGTGKTDVTLQAEISKTLGRVSPYAGAGYRFRGGQRFDNTWLAFVGASFRFSHSISAGLTYEYQEASVNTASVSSEISPYLSLRLGKKTRLVPYGVIGLTDGSPKWGVGSTISYEF